jgi:hypothetical protein
MPKSFPIFIPDKKRQYKPADYILSIGLVITMIIMSLFSKYKYTYLQVSGIIFMSTTFLYYSVLHIRAYFTAENLRGTISGKIIFYPDSIQIRKEIFPIDSIEKITIVNWDNKGRLFFRIHNDYNGVISEGVKNLLSIKLADGNEISTHFQQKDEVDFISIATEIVSYFDQGKMTLKNVLEVLRKDNEDDLKHYRKSYTEN